jgi:hypothetical protein
MQQRERGGLAAAPLPPPTKCQVTFHINPIFRTPVRDGRPS